MPTPNITQQLASWTAFWNYSYAASLVVVVLTTAGLWVLKTGLGGKLPNRHVVHPALFSVLQGAIIFGSFCSIASIVYSARLSDAKDADLAKYKLSAEQQIAEAKLETKRLDLKLSAAERNISDVRQTTAQQGEGLSKTSRAVESLQAQRTLTKGISVEIGRIISRYNLTRVAVASEGADKEAIRFGKQMCEAFVAGGVQASCGTFYGGNTSEPIAMFATSDNAAAAAADLAKTFNAQGFRAKVIGRKASVLERPYDLDIQVNSR